MPGRNADDTQLLIDALRAGGDIARRYFGTDYKIWDKAGTPVTEADIAIDTMLRERLLASRSQYGWLSEETADTSDRLGKERIFVVDPIDGTYGFIKRRPHFTIAAAVVEAHRPVAAAIYNPMTDQMFSASLDDGARLNGDRIEVSTAAALAGTRMLGVREEFKVPAWPASMSVESRSSVAYRMTLVAKGEFDAMVSLSTKGDWDLAAGDLIAGEAGARVTTRDGTTLRYNDTIPKQRSVICAGPALHTILLQKLVESDS